MNLRALSNFLTVAEAGSLQGAANVVHIAQPALTRQIAMLEEEFGTRLFLRHHRGVTLTEAGEQLREHAERILAEVVKTRVAMSTAAKKPTGTVSPQVLFVEHDQMIGALAPDRPDQALNMAVLPGRAE